MCITAQVSREKPTYFFIWIFNKRKDKKMKLPQFYIDDLIKTALQEDINYIDSTTDLLIPEDDISEAYYMAKDSGVLAGVEIAARVFRLPC